MMKFVFFGFSAKMRVECLSPRGVMDNIFGFGPKD